MKSKSAAALRKEAALPYELAATLLDYDPDTGSLTWRHRQPASMGSKLFNTKFAGKIAGSLSKDSGYIMLNMKGVLYRGHRIAWLLHYGEWPSLEVDHRDQVRHNNWINNLRDITHQENHRNETLSKNNTSGITGVYLDRGKWVARIMVDGRAKHLGRFQRKCDAALARDKASIHHGFAEGHGSLKPQDR
jgi:hypothetical protein